MAGKRNLGMGLDLLLTAVATRKVSASEHQRHIENDRREYGLHSGVEYPQGEGNKAGFCEASVRSSAIASMAQAIDEDDKGNIFEAYHFYRRVIECLEHPGLANSPELCALGSQALNNAAVILCENGKSESAQAYLNQALNLHPDNQVARENLQALISEV